MMSIICGPNNAAVVAATAVEAAAAAVAQALAVAEAAAAAVGAAAILAPYWREQIEVTNDKAYKVYL